MTRWLVRKTVLGALWLVFLFGLVEVTGYAYFKLEVSKPIGGYGYPRELFIPLDHVDYSYRPNFRGTFTGAGFYQTPIEINASGFRDEEFGPKRPGTVRIAVLGDSVVFGAGVAAADRFTDRLRGLALPNGMIAEFLNLGVNSYTFVHYLGQVKRNFEGLHPDALVLGFTLNDYGGFESAWPHRVVNVENPPGPEPPLPTRVRRRLVTTYAGRFLADLRDKLMLVTLNLREAYHTRSMRNAVEQWSRPAVQERMREELTEMQALLAQRRLPVLYLVFPMLDDVRDPDQFGKARETLLAMLRELRLFTCDPYPAFARAPDPAALYLPIDNVHFSPAGHRIVAETLAACLRAAGWGRDIRAAR